MKAHRIYLSLFVFLLLGPVAFHLQPMKILCEGLFLILCLLFVRAQNPSENFFLFTDQNRFVPPKKDILLAGEALPSESAADVQDERFLDQHEPKKVVLRNVVSLLCLVIFGLSLRHGPFLGLILGFFIVRSLCVGHFLVPVGINVLIFLANQSYEHSLALTLLFGLSLFVFLAILSWETGDHVRLRKPWSILAITALFFGCVHLGTTLLPLLKSEKKLEQKQEITTHLNRTRSRVSGLQQRLKNLPHLNWGNLADKIQGLSDNLERAEQTVSQGEGLDFNVNLSQLNESLSSLEKEVHEKLTQEQRSLAEREEAGRALAAKLGKLSSIQLKMNLARDLEANQKKMKELQDKLSGSTLPSESDKEELAKLEASGRSLKQDYEESDKLSGPQKKEVEAYLKQKNRDDLTKRELGLGSNDGSLTREALKTLEEKLATGKPVDLAEAKEVLEKRSPPTLSRELPPPPKAEKIPDLKKPESKWVKKFFTFLCLLGIVYFFSLLFKKKIKKVEVGDEVLLQELQNEWGRARSLNLSPREEVIHYYNLLHNSLQKISYADQETPPSCILRVDLSERSELSEAALSVTDIYARCFYGDQEVDLPNLKRFRKSLRQITRAFELAA